jgi:hypothetical protein
LNSLKKDLISQDKIKQIISVLLEHVFLVKEEPVLKEAHNDILNIFLMSESFSFLNESLKKIISKASNIWQVQLFTDLIDG